MKHRWLCTVLLLGLFISLPAQKRLVLDNPYDGVIWTTGGGSTAWESHKANFHTHTTQSDGSLEPDDAIDSYHGKGYTILALTDHNNCTWPWTRYDRDPNDLGMLAVPGNEFSSGHHRGSLFNTIDGNPGSSEGATFKQISDRGGLAMFNHPGRYSESISWYSNLFNSFPIVIGTEIYNQGDRYSRDRETWDAMLTDLMPDRPVWGFSNDDMHNSGHLFRNYNIVFVQSLTEAQVRASLQSGRSYCSYEPGGSGNAKAPVIDSIIVDTLAAEITLYCGNSTSIKWISGGNVLSTDATIACNDYFSESSTAMYVRADLSNSDGWTHIQPFGIRFSAIPLSIAVRENGSSAGSFQASFDGRTMNVTFEKGVDCAVKLMNVKGRLVGSSIGRGDRVHSIPLQSVAAGCYLLSGMAGQYRFSKKVFLGPSLNWKKTFTIQ